MDYVARTALAKCLEEMEVGLEQAEQNLDEGSTTRTRYQRARAAHREVGELVLKVLGARDEPAQLAQATA